MALAWTEKCQHFILCVLFLVLPKPALPRANLLFYQMVPFKVSSTYCRLLVTASMVANMISAPINGSLLSMHGFMGLEGWQWLFSATGMLALLLIAPVLLWFPQGPEQARFLNAEEKSWLIKNWPPNRMPTPINPVNSPGKSLTDWRVLALALVYGFICFGAYGISYWMPTIVKTFGASDMMNGLVNMIHGRWLSSCCAG